MIAGAVGSAAGSLFNVFQGAKMIKEAKKINPVYNPYQESQAVKDIYGQSQQRLNARSPFSAMAQRGIQTSAANAASRVQRGVVDPAMALQSFAAIQGQADEAINKQFMAENQLEAQNFQNLMGAAGMMANEGKFKFQADLGKFDRDMSQKNALRSSGQQNISGGIQGLAGVMTGLGSAKQQQSNFQDYLSAMNGGGAQSALPPTGGYFSQNFNSGFGGISNSMLYKPRGLRTND